MAANTKIEWAERTWNPLLGCSRVSAGCDHCYAINVAHRLASNPNPKVSGAFEGLTAAKARGLDWTARVRCLPERLEQPLTWKKPCRVFVNSLSDLFHEQVPEEFIDEVFAVMALCPQHTFQILTKRPMRMREYMTTADWGHKANYITDKYIRPLEQDLYLGGEIVPPLQNVWLGVSCENQETADERIPFLLQTPAAVRFLSLEPLLGPIDLTRVGPDRWDVLHGWKPHAGPEGANTPAVDWVIVGGESGPGARPVDLCWVRSLRDQCTRADMPYFFKQWGAAVPGEPISRDTIGLQNGETLKSPKLCSLTDAGRVHYWPDCKCINVRFDKKHAGRLLDGREWNEMPAAPLPETLA